MKEIEYGLCKGQYINRFVTTGTFTKAQQFKRAVLKGRVNEWLDKGFAIHENPCRKEFVAQREKALPPYVELEGEKACKAVEVFGQSRTPGLYFPFGNIGYDASSFYKCPTYLRTYCYADVVMPEKEEAELEMETCGGMTLWNNGKLIADFIPFTRNLVKKRTVRLVFEKGRNHLVICLDDLAERDTDYYFRLRYCGEQNPRILLAIPEEEEAEEIKRLERILEGLYFTKESYREEMVCVILPGEAIEEGDRLFVQAGDGGPAISCRLCPGMRQAELVPSSQVLPGFGAFYFEMRTGTVRIRRGAGCQIVWEKLQVKGSLDIEERRKAFLDVICAYGRDDIYKAAAILKTGGDTGQAEQMILHMLEGVNAREDCSDFGFIVVLYVYVMFGEQLSEAVLGAIRQAALNYRYWIDEPGDDVMWFFSENHALLFHICQYFAGSLFPEEYFTNSRRRGMEVKAHGEALLNQWFDSFFAEFVTEWNSNAYIPIDVHGFGFLYNLTGEGELLHEKARKALDMVAYSITVNAHKGVVMTSYGRTYEKELKANDNTGITALLYILYNEGYLNLGGAGTIALALGDYRAPEEYRAYITPEEGRQMVFQNTQGYEHHVNLYLYKNRDVALSTAVQYKPFQKGYQEHIVQASIDSVAQAFINHPGEIQPYGKGRPNFWAGNGQLPLGVQDKDMAVLIYRIPEENRIDFTHAYAPLGEFDSYILEPEANTLAMEKDGAYIGLKAERGILLVKEGVTAYRELVSPGRENVWVLRVGTKREHKSLKEFFAAMKAVRIQRQEGSIAVTDGSRRMEVDGDGRYTLNREPVYAYPLEPKGILNIF